MPAYPAPPSTAHFSAADFFRDCPWLNIPSHRKSEILIEPLYPRLGLLGGAPENGGKLSKLAALAAARKKKEGEKAPSLSETPTPSTPKLEQPTPLTRVHRAPFVTGLQLAGGPHQKLQRVLGLFVVWQRQAPLHIRYRNGPKPRPKGHQCPSFPDQCKGWCLRRKKNQNHSKQCLLFEPRPRHLPALSLAQQLVRQQLSPATYTPPAQTC